MAEFKVFLYACLSSSASFVDEGSSNISEELEKRNTLSSSENTTEPTYKEFWGLLISKLNESL